MNDLSIAGQLDGKLALVTGGVAVLEKRPHADSLKRVQLWWSLVAEETKLKA